MAVREDAHMHIKYVCFLFVFELVHVIFLCDWVCVSLYVLCVYMCICDPGWLKHVGAAAVSVCRS